MFFKNSRANKRKKTGLKKVIGLILFELINKYQITSFTYFFKISSLFFIFQVIGAVLMTQEKFRKNGILQHKQKRKEKGI